jgi:hypothetical protein
MKKRTVYLFEGDSITTFGMTDEAVLRYLHSKTITCCPGCGKENVAQDLISGVGWCQGCKWTPDFDCTPDWVAFGKDNVALEEVHSGQVSEV